MMKKLRNPFLLTGFYGKEYFCDRVKEVEILRNHLQNERNVVLYSWRRMGKTALIKYILTILEKENRAETVYIDLLGTRDLDAALKQITQAVYDRFGKTSSGISAGFQKLLGRVGVEVRFDPINGFPTFGIGLQNHDAAEKSLMAIGEFLHSRKKQVVMALDEFQQITNYPGQYGEAVFRSWMQSFPGIRFVFLGSHRHMMASMFSERNRPFYRSTQLLQLDPIPRKTYERFILDKFKAGKKIIELSTIESIFNWSRMQTYCIQLICNKLFGQFDHVEPLNLENVFKEILEQESPLFSGYTKLLTNMQWKVLQSIAKEEPLVNPLSKEFINRYHMGATSSVSTALRMLQKNELVIEEDGTYFVHDVLLARWLQSL